MNEIVIKLIGNYSYQTNHCLGQGVYGKVYQGVERESKQKVAIKKVDLNTFTNDKYLENAIFSQIYLLKRFDHPNIVKFKDVLSSKNSLYIITQFCKHGDLKEMIKKKKFKQQQAFDVVRQILLGFSQLVKQKIVHRDLKPANILVNDGVYKIADFGFAKYVDNFGSQMLKSCVGSPIYMAPQILERSTYTAKCDIWSIGVIFYEMIAGYPPWKARDQNELLRGIKTIPITNILRRESISAHGNQFLRKCLAYNQQSRANWSELFQLILQPKMQKPTSIIINSTTDILNNLSQQHQKHRFLTPTNNNSYTSSQQQSYQNQINQILTRNRFVTNTFNTQNSGSTTTSNQNARSHTPIRLAKQQSIKSATTNQTIPVNPLSPLTPQRVQRKKSVYNRVSSEMIKNLRGQCIYQNFICAQLLVSYNNVKQFYIDIHKFEKFLFLLISLVRIKSTYLLNQLHLFCRSNKGYDDYQLKSEKQNNSYEELQRDIIALLERQQIIKKIKQQTERFLKTQTNVQEKILKLQSLLVESALQNANIISNQVRIRAKYNKDFLTVQILDWVLDIVALCSNNKQEKLIDQLNGFIKFQQMEFIDYLNKVINKVDKIVQNSSF